MSQRPKTRRPKTRVWTRNSACQTALAKKLRLLETSVPGAFSRTLETQTCLPIDQRMSALAYILSGRGARIVRK